MFYRYGYVYCSLIKDFEDCRSVNEPPRALAALQALKPTLDRNQEFTGERRTQLRSACGANMNFDPVAVLAARTG
jgi:hypothetical protein